MAKNCKLSPPGSAGCATTCTAFTKHQNKIVKALISYLLLCISLLSGSCHSKRDSILNAGMTPFVKEISDQKDFKIYSNSQSKEIFVVFYSKQKGQATVSVYYEDGKLLQQKNLAVNLGTNTWQCYFSFQSSGTYIVTFKMNNLERSGKVFKSVS